jgi:formate-nitrite transporter family protein
VLTRRDPASLVALIRLWGIVLLANLIGAGLFATLAADAPVFEPNLHEDFLTIGEAAANGGFVALFVQAVLAGCLIGLMVWLLPGAGSSRLIVILLITYIVALGGFAHIIAGSVEVLYLVLSGKTSFLSYLIDILFRSRPATSSAAARRWPCSTMPRCTTRCLPLPTTRQTSRVGAE